MQRMWYRAGGEGERVLVVADRAGGEGDRVPVGSAAVHFCKQRLTAFMWNAHALCKHKTFIPFENVQWNRMGIRFCLNGTGRDGNAKFFLLVLYAYLTRDLKDHAHGLHGTTGRTKADVTGAYKLVNKVKVKFGSRSCGL